MAPYGYGLITGQGRSGTNWLLDILDASPDTFCRNEPNVVGGSPFQRLGPLWHMSADPSPLDRCWDAVAEWTVSHQGERDHVLGDHKTFVHGAVAWMGLPSLVQRNGTRRVLSSVVPSLRAAEWPLPRWLGDREAMAAAFGVMKVNRAPRVGAWLLRNRPGVPVINIVRHPGGRHASYLRRFLAGRDSEVELAASRSWLSTIADGEPEWAERFGDPATLDHAEVQTWMWRYVTESLELVGEGAPDYHRVIYEELSADPIAVARELYDRCGLPWSTEVERRILAGRTSSPWGELSPARDTDAWRDSLDPDDVAAIERIVADSPLIDWWATT